MKGLSTFIMACGLLLASSTAYAIVPGQVDDFEDGTVMGWIEGGVSPNPPTNMASGGPAGAGDNFLANVSAGGFGAGSKQIMFNSTQWTGDYLAAGVTQITAMMRSEPGGAPLDMRIAFQGAGGGLYASTTATPIPADGEWHTASFELDALSMTSVGGASSLNDVLSSVTEMRILSSTAPSWIGDTVAATLGVDNLTAVPEPSALALLVMGLPALCQRRRL